MSKAFAEEQLGSIVCHFLVAATVVCGCARESPTLDDSAAGSDTEDAQSDADDPTDDGPDVICKPGTQRCADDTSLEVCSPTGLDWDIVPCTGYRICDDCDSSDDFDGECMAACVGPCERPDYDSSAGCSFVIQPLDPNVTDIAVITNPDPTNPASVEVYNYPNGSNLPDGPPSTYELIPGASQVLEMPWTPVELSQTSTELGSKLASGGVQHLVSNLPVTVSRGTKSGANWGASLVLPERLLGTDYVIYGATPAWAYNPYWTKPVRVRSYVTIVATEDQTTVRWRPTVSTSGDGLSVPAVVAGGEGEQLLNRWDSVRIATPAAFDTPTCEHDLSGTTVTADKPIAVGSSVPTASVPACADDECGTTLECDDSGVDDDLMVEDIIPVDYWGTEYLVPHPPTRSGEQLQVLRVFAGEDDVSVSSDPPQPGMPWMLASKGDFVELILEPDSNLRIFADGLFMPVQYTTGAFATDERSGGPAMVQMATTSRFLDTYTFEIPGVTVDPTHNLEVRHAVRLVRVADAGPIEVDGAELSDDEWSSHGDWSTATIELPVGAHTLTSTTAFGAILYGYARLSWKADGTDHSTGGAARLLGLGSHTLQEP